MKKISNFFRKDECKKHYKFGKALGSGSFATVYLSRHVKDDTEWAIKSIEKKKLTKEDEDALEIEVEAMEKIKHPNVVHLKEIYDTKSHFYMVLEVCAGGELFDRVVEKEKYTEGEAQICVRKLARALKYCHDLGITHRDLKPENLLYATTEDDAEIKIADFGLAKIVGEDLMMKTACGTPGYVAPEILKGQKYGKGVDVWSLGVITYILLCGFPPFYDQNNAELFKQIKAGAYDFPSPYWDDVSDDAKNCIRKMLTVNPSKRVTMAQLLEDKWLKGEEVSNRELPRVMGELKSFNARRKLQSGMRAVKALARFQNMGIKE